MAFDKSTPCAMHSALPDMLDDDDDDIVREVKMLSLVTAREEQERRDRLNRELNLAGKPSDPNLRSSLTLQESSSLPELVGHAGIESASGIVEGSAAKAAIYSQIARPRPHSGRPAPGAVTGVSSTHSAEAPSGGVVPPPLPAIPPNARSRMQTDPIRIPSPPKTAQRNRQQIPAKPRDTSANRSQSLSPPFHRTNLTSVSFPDDLPAQGTVSGSSHDAPLICLSPPVSKYEQVENFDLKSLDPYQPLPTRPPPVLRKSPVSKSVSEPVSQNLSRVSADCKVLPYPVDGLHWPQSPFIGNDAVGGYPAFLGFMPWVTNDLCSPSTPGFPISWMSDSTGNNPASSAAVAETAGRNVHPEMVASGRGSGSDLMDFSADQDGSLQLDPVYMDLADFDPLFTVDSKTWNSEQRFDSDELFLKPGNTLPRSVVSSSAPPRERPLAPLPDVVAQSSVARLMSVDELQDPFSVQDLMASLEKKRQKHAREQEAQDARTQRVQTTHSVSLANATPSKRKV